jgi:hypothetical protein
MILVVLAVILIAVISINLLAVSILREQQATHVEVKH